VGDKKACKHDSGFGGATGAVIVCGFPRKREEGIGKMDNKKECLDCLDAKIDKFAEIGKSFKIISDRYMRPDVLILVSSDEMSYGYYNNDKLDRKEIPTQGRYQRWSLSFQTYGVVARNPRSNIGMIYGLPTE
jgi:hypothetical protein